jgi:hypothetical protein
MTSGLLSNGIHRPSVDSSLVIALVSSVDITARLDWNLDEAVKEFPYEELRDHNVNSGREVCWALMRRLATSHVLLSLRISRNSSLKARTIELLNTRMHSTRRAIIYTTNGDPSKVLSVRTLPEIPPPSADQVN